MSVHPPLAARTERGNRAHGDRRMNIPLLKSSNGHTWRFFRAGGFDQVRIDSGADLAALGQLDQKLWVALACPTRGIEFDNRTLDLIDTDNDGRIRAPEILAATAWACAMLKDPDLLVKSATALPLAAISDQSAEAIQIRSSAKQILANLGKADAAEITADDVADTARIFAATKFNGDGIIPADSAEDAATQAVLADIIVCAGSETDRSGKPGVTQARVDLFFAEAQAYADWWAKAEADKAAILPLGDATAAACALCSAIKLKVEDYFARCRLAAFDPRALTAVNREEVAYLAMAAKDLTINSAEIAAFPLARVEAGKPLPLKNGLNPAWADSIGQLRDQIVKPLLGERDAMSESDWAALNAKLAPFSAWLQSKGGAVVEKLNLPRVREILAGGAKAAINDLIAKDKALEPEANAIAAVERLIRYVRDLHKLLDNFVAFRAFYGRREKAVFQAGTLYLDQRSCELCVQVADMGRQGIMSHLSRAYLVYCDLTRKVSNEKMTIMAAFMDGDSDNLMVGRNGIFYDRKGRDWDATIVKIVDNPISIRQAFWAPYKRCLRWIEDQIAKRAAAADAASTDKLTGAAAATGDAAAGKAPAPKPKIDIGVVAAIGVAVGGITAALGALLQAFFGLGIWMPLGLIALMLLISGPSMIIAWLKLRQRNLGPILDANGWAVNARAKINIPFGKSLTPIAKLPAGSVRDLTDPYAQSQSGRYKFAAVVLLLIVLWCMWYFGCVDHYVRQIFPNLPKSSFVQAREDKAKAGAEKIQKDATGPTATQPAPHPASAPAK